MPEIIFAGHGFAHFQIVTDFGIAKSVSTLPLCLFYYRMVSNILLHANHTHTLLSSSFFCEIIFPSIYVNACRLLLRTHYIEIITISSLSLSSSLLQQQQEQQQWRFSIWQIWLAQIIIANDCVACMHKHCKK